MTNVFSYGTLGDRTFIDGTFCEGTLSDGTSLHPPTYREPSLALLYQSQELWAY